MASPRTLHAAGRPHILRLQRVAKTYPGEAGDIAAVRDLRLDVFPGEFLSLIGPSGCGKTTILNLMAGLEPPSAGDIEFHDQAVRRVPRQIGYVFQEPTLLPWRTLFQNVALPLELGRASFSREAVQAALAAVGLEAFESEYPESLSAGMRQKAAIARALVHDPEVLLMDEPFSSLDLFSREQLNFQLLDLWQRMQKTVVLVTHSISEAVLLSDRVCLLTPRPGTICEEIPIQLPRPRDADTVRSAAFSRLLARIHQSFGRLTGE